MPCATLGGKTRHRSPTALRLPQAFLPHASCPTPKQLPLRCDIYNASAGSRLVMQAIRNTEVSGQAQTA